jgi:hypothetical protein
MSGPGWLVRLGLIVVSGATLAYGQGSNAPLPLFINGGGSVSPLTNGEWLVVGQTYHLQAAPDPGFIFSGWQRVNVFTTSTFVVETNGNTNTVISVVASPAPTYTNQLTLDFVMQPVVLIVDTGLITITQSSGWQANFAPVILEIQFLSSDVVLQWTNSLFQLQAAPAPGGRFTNVPAAVSPYTNTVSGQARYFRLFSN